MPTNLISSNLDNIPSINITGLTITCSAILNLMLCFVATLKIFEIMRRKRKEGGIRILSIPAVKPNISFDLVSGFGKISRMGTMVALAIVAMGKYIRHIVISGAYGLEL
ncbi:hypothetical protein ES705_41630 [subsurface metagenome]